MRYIPGVFLPSPFRRSLSPPFVSIAVIAFAVTLSGCGDARRVRAPAPISSPAPQTVNAVPTDENGTPLTPEQIRTQKVQAQVTENLPNAEMSKQDFEKILADADKNYVDDGSGTSNENSGTHTYGTPGTNPEASPIPSPAPSPATNFLTERPDPIVAKQDHTRVVHPPLPKIITPPVKDPAPPAKDPSPPKKDPAPKKPPVKNPTPPKKNPTPPPPPIENPSTDPNADNGVDADDEKAADDYAGPKTVVEHPQSTADFQLSEVAAQLAALPKRAYLNEQRDKTGINYPACNYFLITALVDAKVTDERHLPLFMAGSFDTEYFIPKGWKRISLATMKKWFKDGKSFDVAIQRDPPKGMRNGHVAIPIGLNAQGAVMIAEGVLNGAANKIAIYSDSSLDGKYKIFARD
jgi:hypothetical protein